jgi:hypothetical protein
MTTISSDVRHYRLLPEALPVEQKRMRTAWVPGLLIVLALTTVVFVFLGTRAGATPASMLRYALIMLAYMAYLAWRLPRKLKKKLEKCWQTYDLEIGPDYLLRRQSDLPDLQLKFSQIQAVQRIPGRYVRVLGTPKTNAISIPEGIENFAEVLGLVSSIRTPETRRVEDWLTNRIFMGIGLIAYIVMLWSTRPVIVIPLSLTVAGTIIWFFFWIRRNPNLPKRNKWMAWYFLLFLLMCAVKLLVALDAWLPHRPLK